MFERIDINLTEPLCDCHGDNIRSIKYSWCIDYRSDGPGLGIACLVCGTKLSVPNKKSIARFKFPQEPPPKSKEPLPDDEEEYEDDEDEDDSESNVVRLHASGIK